MADLVMRDAWRAPDVIAKVLDDPNYYVRMQAARYLSLFGDKRGLDKEAAGLKFRDFQAARFLGYTRQRSYAQLLSKAVRSCFEEGLRKDGSWFGSATNRGFLAHGTVALARMGRQEDWPLILRILAAKPDRDMLEALGEVNLLEARSMLRTAYERAQGLDPCSGGSGVFALLPLSRLGDQRAIGRLDEILRGALTPKGPWPAERSSAVQSCRIQDEALRALRPRDASYFADTVFGVAAEVPEGSKTVAAWDALGVMHPHGFGERILALALSRKSLWKLVGRDRLFRTVIAIDPDLNDRFWTGIGAPTVEPHHGERALVRRGVGFLLFDGSFWWSGV